MHSKKGLYKFGDCEFDITACTLTRDGKEVKLTPTEFRMLKLFLRRAGCALTRNEILNAVWGYSHLITLLKLTVLLARLNVTRFLARY